MSFQSLKEIIKKSKTEKLLFWEIILDDDIKERQISKDISFKQMAEMYHAMQTADAEYNPSLKSSSNLTGGDAKKITDALEAHTLICGDFIGKVMEKALKMGESNACMKRIVAAPTAGSCGVIPAVFLTYAETYHIPEEKMLEALYVAGGIGEVIAYRAFISGAAGGCQAEIGSASAMAAGGMAYLRGGDASTICHAAAMALKNLLGLACDPVAGLVEVPCIKRNVIGAINAITSADMALAGIKSAIPPDEVIDAMKNIGRNMSESIRETGEGGLAITPTGIKIKKSLL